MAANDVELIVLVGDLEPAWTAGLAAIALPKLGVHGNHDAPGTLAALGAEDVHLRRVEHGGLSFSGFAGAPRYDFTDEEAAALVGRLPAADVLVTHTPPAGVNDDPDDPVHRGWPALRGWVEREQPSWLLHGHTTPLPGRRAGRLGATRIAYIRGAAILEVSAGPARP